MWLLLIVSCVGSDGGPLCRSNPEPVAYRLFVDCEDAAMRADAAGRDAAETNGLAVLLLETRCLDLRTLGTPVGGAP